MLTIDQRELGPSGLQRRGEVPAPGEAWPDVPLAEEGAELAYEIAPARDEDLRVTGTLAVTLRLGCRRCLRPLERRLVVPFAARFRPGGGEGTPEEAIYPLPPEARPLDLTEMLREELLLALPKWPLCRPDCAGLCPRCGTDWNEAACDCVQEERDPRWDALRAVRES